MKLYLTLDLPHLLGPFAALRQNYKKQSQVDIMTANALGKFQQIYMFLVQTLGGLF